MVSLAKQLDPRLIDGLKNGIAQKFEYTLELCWKCIKDFLRKQEGIDEATPKKVVKAFYLAGYAKEDMYLALLQAIDDRNQLSHVYDESTFSAILGRIPEHTRYIHEVIALLAD